MEPSVNLKNGMILNIRVAEKTDAQPMVEYLRKISGESDFLTFGKGELNITAEDESSFIEDIARKDNCLFLVAEIDNKIVGNINFSGGPRSRNRHVGEFGISVLESHWGLGIGKELLKHMLNWCKSSNILTKINLKVRTDNHRAIELYKSLGFAIEGTVSRDIKIGDTYFASHLMGLEID